jgi:uncharacterized membrane protein YtjA (UPF0391 family)
MNTKGQLLSGSVELPDKYLTKSRQNPTSGTLCFSRRSSIVKGLNVHSDTFATVSRASAPWKWRKDCNTIGVLHYSLVFLIIAIIAGILGFAGIAGTAVGIAKILFFVFLVIWLITFLTRSKPV